MVQSSTNKTQTSIETQIRQSVADVISGTAENNKQRYEGVDVVKTDSGKWKITVHMYVDAAMSTDQSVKDELIHAYDVNKTLFGKYKDIDRILYRIDAPLKDTYGNVKDDLWFRFVINGDDGYKIKYENMSSEDLIKFYELQYSIPDARKASDTILSSQ